MPTAPECPRCGYDLTGQIAAWHPQGDCLDGANCPTQSTCSECGLTFDWRALLNPTISGPTWFLETARHKYLRTTRITWLQALRPWTFWRTISLELRPRPRRILLSLALLLATFFLLHAVMGIAGRFGMIYFNPQTVGRWAAAKLTTPSATAQHALYCFAVDWKHQFLFGTGPERYGSTLCAWMGPFVGFTLMPPIMLLCLPWTRAVSKVRTSHIVRAAVYAFTPLLLLLIIILTCDAMRYTAAFSGFHASNFYDGIDGPFRTIHPLFNGSMFTRLKASTFYATTLFLWYLIYWYQVLRHGWRMADYRPVYFALIIPAVLLTLLILVLIPGAMLMTV